MLPRGIGGGAESSRGDHPAAFLGLIEGTRGCARALPVHGFMIGTVNICEIIFALHAPPLILVGVTFTALREICGGMLPARRAARRAPALAV